MGTSLPGLLVNTSATCGLEYVSGVDRQDDGGQAIELKTNDQPNVLQYLEGLGQEPLNLPRPGDLDLVLRVESK